MTELLSNRSELPHFWFHEALFKPLDGIMSSPKCTEEEQEQVRSENVFVSFKLFYQESNALSKTSIGESLSTILFFIGI